MLEKKTVFILGAGASKPYNFPTAIELSKDVISNFDSLIISIYETLCTKINESLPYAA